MSRWFICTASITMFIAGSGLTALQAQQAGPYELPSPAAIPLLAAAPLMPPASYPMAAGATMGQMAPQQAAQQAGYVNLNAPMYPSPRPNIPIWTGGTMITNQAFAPHEMLYPHSYRAMYGPFYHRARGCYVWTPFGMRTHEKWDLLGTTVKVDYRSSWPKFGPQKPVISSWGGPWK